MTYANKTVTESMSELLTSAEFIAHVAYPGAVAATEISAVGVRGAPSRWIRPPADRAD